MIPKLCAMAILFAVCGVMLAEFGWKGKRIFSVLCILALLSLAGEGIATLFDGIMKYSESAGVSEAARCAVKILGVGYVFGITSDISAELGESGISAAVSTVGRVEVVIIVLPYFEKVLSYGLELIG